MGCGASKSSNVATVETSMVIEDLAKEEDGYDPWTLEGVKSTSSSIKSKEQIQQQHQQQVKEQEQSKELAKVPSNRTSMEGPPQDPPAPIKKTISKEVHLENLKLLLKAEDTDNIGFVHYTVLRKVILSLSVQLEESYILRLLAEAEQNGRGMVYYEAYAKRVAALLERISNDEYSIKQTGSIYRHLDENKIIKLLQKNLKEAASDWLTGGTETLTRYNFRRLLETSDLGLSSKEVNAALCQVAEEPPMSGSIPTEEAIIQCVHVVLHMEPFVLLDQQRSSEQWVMFLQNLFQARDRGKTGILENYSVRELLAAADLGLMPLKIIQLMTTMKIDDVGKVYYAEYINAVAEQLMNFYDLQKIQSKHKKAEEIEKTYINKYSNESLHLVLNTLGSLGGKDVPRAVFVNTVESVLNLNELEVRAVQVILVGDTIDFNSFVPLIFDVLNFIDKDKAIHV